jgi:hypothetical protein
MQPEGADERSIVSHWWAIIWASAQEWEHGDKHALGIEEEEQ